MRMLALWMVIDTKLQTRKVVGMELQIFEKTGIEFVWWRRQGRRKRRKGKSEESGQRQARMQRRHRSEKSQNRKQKRELWRQKQRRRS